MIDELRRPRVVLRVLDSRKAPLHVADQALNEALVVPPARHRRGVQRRSPQAAAAAALEHARAMM
jgi:hypothetical protein